MLTTYRAILNGDRIKWLDTPPAQLDGVEVNITLTQTSTVLSHADRMRALEEVLKLLAESNPFEEIEDPVAWQREMRKDRPLPYRD